MRWPRPPTADESGRRYNGIADLAAENRLEIGTTANIALTDDQNPARTANGHNTLDGKQMPTPMGYAIRKTPRCAIDPPPARQRRICHGKAGASDLKSRVDRPSHSSIFVRSLDRTRECVGMVKSRWRRNVDPGPAFSPDCRTSLS